MPRGRPTPTALASEVARLSPRPRRTAPASISDSKFQLSLRPQSHEPQLLFLLLPGLEPVAEMNQWLISAAYAQLHMHSTPHSITAVSVEFKSAEWDFFCCWCEQSIAGWYMAAASRGRILFDYSLYTVITVIIFLGVRCLNLAHHPPPLVVKWWLKSQTIAQGNLPENNVLAVVIFFNFAYFIAFMTWNNMHFT